MSTFSKKEGVQELEISDLKFNALKLNNNFCVKNVSFYSKPSLRNNHKLEWFSKQCEFLLKLYDIDDEESAEVIIVK